MGSAETEAHEEGWSTQMKSTSVKLSEFLANASENSPEVISIVIEASEQATEITRLQAMVDAATCTPIVTYSLSSI